MLRFKDVELYSEGKFEYKLDDRIKNKLNKLIDYIFKNFNDYDIIVDKLIELECSGDSYVYWLEKDDSYEYIMCLSECYKYIENELKIELGNDIMKEFFEVW